MPSDKCRGFHETDSVDTKYYSVLLPSLHQVVGAGALFDRFFQVGHHPGKLPHMTEFAVVVDNHGDGYTQDWKILYCPTTTLGRDIPALAIDILVAIRYEIVKRADNP